MMAASYETHNHNVIIKQQKDDVALIQEYMSSNIEFYSQKWTENLADTFQLLDRVAMIDISQYVEDHVTERVRDYADDMRQYMLRVGFKPEIDTLKNQAMNTLAENNIIRGSLPDLPKRLQFKFYYFVEMNEMDFETWKRTSRFL